MYRLVNEEPQAKGKEGNEENSPSRTHEELKMPQKWEQVSVIEVQALKQQLHSQVTEVNAVNQQAGLIQ